MQQTPKCKESTFGFKLESWRSRIHPLISTCEPHFAADITLLPQDTDQAQELLTGVELKPTKVELQLTRKVISPNAIKNCPTTSAFEKTQPWK